MLVPYFLLTPIIGSLNETCICGSISILKSVICLNIISNVDKWIKHNSGERHFYINIHNNQETFFRNAGVNFHDEADTRMILHAAELGTAGKTVQLMTQETDALVLALRMSFY